MSPNVLAKGAVDAVRVALEQHFETLGAEPAPELRSALHALARDARARAMSPEDLLVTLKGIWQSLPGVNEAHDDAEQTRVLQRAVTICIKAYFGE